MFLQPAPEGSVVPGQRLVYLGDDASGRAIEVIAVPLEPTETGEARLCVIHAMKCRQKYKDAYEEASKWRL